MFKPLFAFLDPLLQPGDRIRWLCLLLLVTLVTAMLYLGVQPGIGAVIPNPPWDKVAHMIAYAGFAALAWVVFGARAHVAPVLMVGVISLMDEGLQYYTPGRTADLGDIAADLVGASLVVLALRVLRAEAIRQRAVRTA